MIARIKSTHRLKPVVAVEDGVDLITSLHNLDRFELTPRPELTFEFVDPVRVVDLMAGLDHVHRDEREVLGIVLARCQTNDPSDVRAVLLIDE